MEKNNHAKKLSTSKKCHVQIVSQSMVLAWVLWIYRQLYPQPDNLVLQNFVSILTWEYIPQVDLSPAYVDLLEALCGFDSSIMWIYKNIHEYLSEASMGIYHHVYVNMS